MSLRTIMIFPDFENIEIINNIRKKYDPLADLVLPHITLVFPFESELTNEELNLHLKECLSEIRPFIIELKGFCKQEDRYGNYLFLNIIQGMDEIKKLHDVLYEGKMSQYRLDKEYIPHLTVGKVISEEILEKAYEDIKVIKDRFTTTVRKISVEMIGEHEESVIIIEYEL